MKLRLTSTLRPLKQYAYQPRRAILEPKTIFWSSEALSGRMSLYSLTGCGRISGRAGDVRQVVEKAVFKYAVSGALSNRNLCFFLGLTRALQPFGATKPAAKQRMPGVFEGLAPHLQ